MQLAVGLRLTSLSLHSSKKLCGMVEKAGLCNPPGLDSNPGSAFPRIPSLGHSASSSCKMATVVQLEKVEYIMGHSINEC